MKNRTIKNLAFYAKNRLIQKGGLPHSVASMDNVTFKLLSNDDDLYLEKVKTILERNSISPMKEMMDKETYDNLDPFGKQKYLLDSLELFQRLKNKIELENSRKIVY